MHNRRPPPKSEQPALTVDPTHLNFGEVWETEKFEWSFPVVNRGTRSITVEKVTGSCTCLSISPDQFTIEPGATQVIAVRVDFTVKSRKDDAAAFMLTYQTSDDLGQRKTEGRWLISGRVKPFLTLDTPLDFGRRSVLDQPFRPVTFGVRFGAAVESVTVTPLDSRIQVDVVRDGPADRYRYALSAVGAFPCGQVNTAVLLNARLVSGGERLERIPITGRVVPDVELSPPAFPGGGRLIGEWFEFDITVSSISMKPFSVVGVKAIGEGLSVVKKDGRYVVRQDCVAAGEQCGRVEFEIVGADGRYATSVSIDYTGIRR